MSLFNNELSLLTYNEVCLHLLTGNFVDYDPNLEWEPVETLSIIQRPDNTGYFSTETISNIYLDSCRDFVIQHMIKVLYVYSFVSEVEGLPYFRTFLLFNPGTLELD